MIQKYVSALLNILCISFYSRPLPAAQVQEMRVLAMTSQRITEKCISALLCASCI
jgi:hypothetical protein